MSEKSKNNIVIIGSGTGGPNALEVIFENLPKLEVSIIIVQHMPKDFDERLAKRLNGLTELKVKLAEENDELQHGIIYIAPVGKQLEVVNNSKIKFSECPSDTFSCPSIDECMKSLSFNKTDRLVGIILSGIGKSGCEGIEYIKEIGGTTMAQDVPSSVISHMPENAIETGKIDFVFKPFGIRSKLIKMFKKNNID